MQSVAVLIFVMDNRYYHICMADLHMICFRASYRVFHGPNMRTLKKQTEYVSVA